MADVLTADRRPDPADPPAVASRARRRLVVQLPRPEAELSLICFPHAGGSPGAFRRWARLLPPWIEPSAVLYPAPPAPGSGPTLGLAGLAEEIAAEIGEATAAKAPMRPTVFFGHSMGATVAFEVARRTEPTHLFASSQRSPQDPRRDLTDLADDGELLHFISKLGGSGALALRYPEMRTAMVSALRADLDLFHRYRYVPGPALGCPVTVLRGAQDPLVSQQDALAWRELTAADFAVRVFPGGHFYLEELRRPTVAFVLDRLGLENRAQT